MTYNLYLLTLLMLLMGSSFSTQELFTSEEKKALKKFGPLVNDITTHDYQKIDSYLIRWLRAKKLNVDDAVQMFTKAQQWRKVNKIDGILNETFPEFDKIYNTADGRDYMGRVVVILNYVKLDYRRIVIQGKKNRYDRFFIQGLEEGIVRSFEPSVNLTFKDTRAISITDLNGFSLRKHACFSCISILVDGIHTLDNYYPGLAVLDIYINTPRIALPFVQTLISFASPETRNTVKIFGTNRTEWSSFLLKIIPPNQLTYQFGGTKPS